MEVIISSNIYTHFPSSRGLFVIREFAGIQPTINQTIRLLIQSDQKSFEPFRIFSVNLRPPIGFESQANKPKIGFPVPIKPIWKCSTDSTIQHFLFSFFIVHQRHMPEIIKVSKSENQVQKWGKNAFNSTKDHSYWRHLGKF